jgi:hypothetical protein
MRALAVALLLIAPGVVFAFKNEPGGFRGIQWAAPLDTVRDELSPSAASAATLATYQRKDDKMTIGEAQLSRITYVFYKDRFQQAMLRTADGLQHARALRDAFTAQFGPGDQPNRYLDRWFWHGAQTMIYLDCHPRTYCTASLMSRAVYEEQQRDKKAAAEGAKKDF